MRGLGWLSDSIGKLIPEGTLHDLLIDGVIGGVGGVIVFLPNILILFFCISLMEDTGYMARAAFIMDRLMHKIGLHGKSFIPLLMGFGCNVPAIMATRTLENRKDRLLTMLIIPFMSCSARLAGLCPADIGIFPCKTRFRATGNLPDWCSTGSCNGVAFQKDILQKSGSSVCNGIATIPHANTSKHKHSYVE